MQSRHFPKFFALVLLLLSFMPLASSLAQDELGCGDVVTGELEEASDTVSFDLLVEEGQMLILTLESDDFDTVLEVYEDGDLIAENDDGGDATNSQLTLLELGEFEIVVSSFAGVDDGEFELQIECAEGCQVIEDELSDGDEVRQYQFSASEDETVLLYLASDEFDPYLSLLDEDDDEIAYDDDSGMDHNSLLSFEIEEDGNYIADVSAFFTSEAGDFTLIICTETEAAIETIEVSSETERSGGRGSTNKNVFITCGETIEGTIDDETPIVNIYYDGSEGDELTIKLDATDGDLDPYLQLLDPDGDLIAENDDADDFNSEIEYELEDAGEYTIVATRFLEELGSSDGDFELELECG